MTNDALDPQGNRTALFVMRNKTNYNNSEVLRVVREVLEPVCVCNKSFL